MVFPIAGIEVSPWLPLIVAFSVSFFTSMGGVSGAFLLLPFQMSFLGYTAPSVSATNQLFNIVAIPSGVYRYWKEGRMVWPLTWAVVVGTLPGVFIGAILRIVYLPDPSHFKLFAALVLLYIGVRMLLGLIQQSQRKANEKSDRECLKQIKDNVCGKSLQCTDAYGVEIVHVSMNRLSYTFQREHYDVSLVGIVGVSFIVGIAGGIYGIGGGSIMAPFFVAFFGLPVYTIAGAALMGTFMTSVAGVVFYQAIAPFYPEISVAPDWLLGVLFGIGGMAGMYLGARCQKFMPAGIIKWMLTMIIMFTAIKYIVDFFN